MQCNGFSAGVNPDDFRGPGYESGYDPVWCDLLEKHSESPFHVLVGGGDQLYCDRSVLLLLNNNTQYLQLLALCERLICKIGLQ